jgi:hypothetical protein
VVAVGVNFVVADKVALLTMQTRHVSSRQNLQDTTIILAAHLALIDLQHGAELGIDGDQLLDQIQIVAGLILIVCDQKTIVPLHASRNQQLKQRRERDVGRFIVLFRSARQDEVVDREPVLIEGIERHGVQAAPIFCHGVEQRTTIEPFQMAIELQ